MKDQFGGWGGGEEFTKSGSGDNVLTTTHMLVSGIFRQLTTFVVVPDVVTRFSKIGSVFFFRWSACCQNQLKLYPIVCDL